MNIIKTLKSSISEKGNYCYSLPVETTKEIIKDVKQLQQENQKYKEVINKAIEYIKQLDELERKIDDYAISKYVRKELLDILKEVE